MVDARMAAMQPPNCWCPMAYNLRLTLRCPMEYKRIVQTVVETPPHLAIANKLLARRSGRTSWHFLRLTRNVVRGTGGFRKVRVARKGMGNSGGARVVYIWRNERFPVF